MKPSRSGPASASPLQLRARLCSLLAVTAPAAIVILAAVLAVRSGTPRESVASVQPARQASTPGQTPSSTTPTVNQAGTVLHPLPVFKSSALHEWTAEDCKSPQVLERIVHNEEEFIRLMEENDRIKRRQLVYRKETVLMLLDRARASGQPLNSFTLPGLDGREVEVEVTEIHFADAQGGAVQGRLKGRYNSSVSVGFSNGCESFNVISPDEHLFLTADAREPGEVFVKEIDPEVYGHPPQSGVPDFILTGETHPAKSR